MNEKNWRLLLHPSVSLAEGEPALAAADVFFFRASLSSATPYKEIWERDYPDWALGSCIYTQTWCTTDYMLISTDHAVIHGIHTLALQAKLQQLYPIISTEDTLSSNTLSQSQPLTRLRLNLNSFNLDAVICESICQLIIGVYEPDLQELLCYPFTHKMKIYFDVLCSCVKYQVS